MEVNYLSTSQAPTIVGHGITTVYSSTMSKMTINYGYFLSQFVVCFPSIDDAQPFGG